MNEPRNVTPGIDGTRTTADEDLRRTDGAGTDAPEWQSWTWGGGRGRGFPWLGVLLVLVGLALLVQYLFPRVSVGTLVLLAVGLAFVASWAFGRSSFAIVPGALFVALGVAELIEDMALLGPAGEDVPGLASASLAIGFLVIWAIGAASKRRWTWPLWGAGLFGLIGVAQLSGRIANIPELGFLWPVLIIIVGVVLLMGARRR